MLAYQGKKGCTDLRCTRLPDAEAKGYCFGWHCPRCDEPCSSQGHKCDVTVTHPEGDEG